MIEFQDTQPLPVIGFSRHIQESREQRYRRLKAIADLTGVRLFFVYLQEQGKPTRGDLHWKRGRRA